MDITESVMLALGVSRSRSQQYLEALNAAMGRAEVTTPLRSAHYLAQLLHESAQLRFTQENLNYSAEGLRKVFPRYFTPAQARAYARQPKKIGARVYANRMGNGDEASGDGYRYRGRGFIQLTGKDNYRQFSDFIGDDVVGEPDKVATIYPAASASRYWVERDINTLADRDDVRAVTRAINGGLNGLDDRMRLLDLAKSALSVDSVIHRFDGASHLVTASQLNLRSRPSVSASTWIATMPQGTPVRKLGGTGEAGWSRVSALLDGRLVEGVVASRFLSPIRESAPVPGPVLAAAAILPELPEAHLREGRRDITRMRDGGRAYPLGESRMPRRRGRQVPTLISGLNGIVDYLDSANSLHKRYQPGRGVTYCNIYTCDYTYLAGAYIPRVWWNDRALQALRAGEEVEASYGQTVRELNANMLHDWFEDFGRGYGWKRLFNLDELQASANNGEVAIIVGHNRDPNRSGHIAAVVPEQDGARARRNAAGEVLLPVVSQAGRTNVTRAVASSRWWASSGFRSFAYWRHP